MPGIMKVERVGIIDPPTSNTLTPEQAAKGTSTTTMIFDKPVLLTVRHGIRIKFPAGVHMRYQMIWSTTGTSRRTVSVRTPSR